jgi:hypothetical protein
MKYTPCLSWSACTKGLDCPFRHPQPLQAEFPAFEAVFGPERSIPTLTEFRHIPQEINGTTYYPIIPVSVPAPVDCSNIVPYTVPYPESEPTCYPSETVRETDILQSSPSLNDSHQNSNHEVGLAMSTSAMDSHTHTEEHEFPYRPDRNQRAGHTRRVSVNVHVPNHDVQASVDSISALKTHTSRKVSACTIMLS